MPAKIKYIFRKTNCISSYISLILKLKISFCFYMLMLFLYLFSPSLTLLVFTNEYIYICVAYVKKRHGCSFNGSCVIPTPKKNSPYRASTHSRWAINVKQSGRVRMNMNEIKRRRTIMSERHVKHAFVNADFIEMLWNYWIIDVFIMTFRISAKCPEHEQKYRQIWCFHTWISVEIHNYHLFLNSISVSFFSLTLEWNKKKTLYLDEKWWILEII